jgi:hypothetical protein
MEVDLSGTGGREFELVQTSNQNGFVAQIDDWQTVLRTTGKFYFVPTFDPNSEARFTQAPVTSQLTFSGIGRLATDPPDAPERRISFLVQFKEVSAGYSTSGPNIVPQQSGKLATYRVQQRLRYLGYQNRTGNASDPVSVDGLMGPGTRHAIGVFNAAVTNADHVDENSEVIDPFINMANAPAWVEVRFGAGITNNQGDPENWMTSWTREALEAADALLDSVLQYTGAIQKGGGNTRTTLRMKQGWTSTFASGMSTAPQALART